MHVFYYSLTRNFNFNYAIRFILYLHLCFCFYSLICNVFSFMQNLNKSYSAQVSTISRDFFKTKVHTDLNVLQSEAFSHHRMFSITYCLYEITALVLSSHTTQALDSRGHGLFFFCVPLSPWCSAQR